MLLSLILFISPVAPAVLTLEKALEVANQNSQQLAAAREIKSQGQSQVGIARSGLFPDLSLKASTGSKKSSLSASQNAAAVSTLTSDTYLAQVVLTQPLYSGGKLTATLSGAKAQGELDEQTFFQTSQQTFLNVVSQYYDLTDMALRLKEAEFNRDMLQSYLDITRRNERIGRSRNIDRLQAEVSYGDALIEVENLKIEYQKSLADFKTSINWQAQPNPPKGDTEIEVKIEIPEVGKIDVEQAFESSQKNNPDIRMTQIQVELVEYQRDIEMAVEKPSLNLEASYGYSSADRPSLFDEESNTYSVMVNLNIPLFSGLRSFSKSSLYSSQKTAAEIKKAELSAKIRTDLETTLQQIEIQKNILSQQEKNLKEARSALDISLRNYRVGTASSQDVIQMQKTRYEVAKRYIVGQIAYLKNILKLRQLLGIDIYKSYTAKSETGGAKL